MGKHLTDIFISVFPLVVQNSSYKPIYFLLKRRNSNMSSSGFFFITNYSNKEN